MIRFINKLTGSLMLVVPERKAEYLAVGHRLADEPPAPKAKPPRAAPAAAKRPGKAAKKKEG